MLHLYSKVCVMVGVLSGRYRCEYFNPLLYCSSILDVKILINIMSISVIKLIIHNKSKCSGKN